MCRTFVLAVSLLAVVCMLVACAPPTPQIVEKEVVVEKPVVETVVVEKEVIVEKEKVVEKVVTATPSQEVGEPPYGGTYRLLGTGVINSLDPPGAWNWPDWWTVGGILFQQLYAYDLEGNIQPVLAAEMPSISEDATVYTIPLRRDVRFHNGRGMVAADVKFSLERQLWPEVDSWGKSFMENLVGWEEVIDGATKELSGVKVIDDYTIEITLKSPQAVFPALLSVTANAVVPREEVIEAGDQWGSRVVIGTGPFRLVQWSPGEKAIYERNPDYFRPGLPYLDRVELHEQVDQAIQMLRWEAGEAEYIHEVPPAELPRVLTDPALRSLVRETETLLNVRLLIHTQTSPFDDVRVRQAVAMAVDKQGIERSEAGRMIKLEGLYPPTFAQFDKAFTSDYSYDPAGARQLLAEAGYPDGIKGVKFFARADSRPVAEMLLADLFEIGIEAELVIGDRPAYRDRIRQGEIPLVLIQWGASYPDAFDYISAWASCRAIEVGENIGMYCNQRIDELMEKAEALPINDPERTALYREIERIVINEDVAFVSIGSPIQMALGVSYMHDDRLMPVFSWPDLERAWMEKR